AAVPPKAVVATESAPTSKAREIPAPAKQGGDRAGDVAASVKTAPVKKDATPSAPTGPGRLSVETRPTGARVFLDSQAVGVTPLSLPTVPAGDHAIRLQLDGYRLWVSTVKVAPDEQLRVTASLERQ